MANSPLPFYEISGNNMRGSSVLSPIQYTQLDLRPVFSGIWTVPSTETSSPRDQYASDQPSLYMSEPLVPTDANQYNPSCRWSQPMPSCSLDGVTTYPDQNLEYAIPGSQHSPSKYHSTAITEFSALTTTSTEMTLPERPFSKRSQVSNSFEPQRQLPMPQPNAALSSRNAVDQLQDQRIRRYHTASMGLKAISEKSASFRAADSNVHVENLDVKPMIGMAQDMVSQHTPLTISSMAVPVTKGQDSFYDTTATSQVQDVTCSDSLVQFNFETPLPFSTIAMQAPTATYSNFRGDRASKSFSTSMAPPIPETTSYSFGHSKSTLLEDQSSNDHTLVSGYQYTPLSHQTLSSGNNLSHQSSWTKDTHSRLTPVSTGNGDY